MASYKYLKTATLGTVTLDSGYTSGSGSMVLTAGQGARLPSAGDFWLAWSEDQSDPDAVIHLWKVTARSTDTLTVTAEASEGGGDTNVSAGETLRAVLSISALDQLRQDICQTGAYASAATEKAGAIYLPSDSFYTLRDSGSAFVPWGPIFPMTIPTDPGTWVNQGTSTVDSTRGAVVMVAQATAANNARCRVAAAPATPYTKTIAFLANLFGTSATCGLLFRENGTGELSWLQTSVTRNAAVNNMNSPTSFSAQPAVVSFPFGPVFFFQISDDGANRIYRVSSDGINFVQIYSVARTTFLTADEWGIFVNSDSTTIASSMTVLHMA